MTTQTTPSNPNSIKTRFTYRFVQALRKLNKTRSVSVSPSMKETYRRYHMIRVASYASMASAVGSRRAWSRTVLWKIRNRTLHRTLKKKGKIHALRRRKVRENPRNSLNFHRENDLKKLVPGGEGMDFCRLLNETAHYIKCLRTQVQIMNNIVDHCSNWAIQLYIHTHTHMCVYLYVCMYIWVEFDMMKKIRDKNLPFHPPNNRVLYLWYQIHDLCLDMFKSMFFLLQFITIFTSL